MTEWDHDERPRRRRHRPVDTGPALPAPAADRDQLGPRPALGSADGRQPGRGSALAHDCSIDVVGCVRSAWLGWPYCYDAGLCRRAGGSEQPDQVDRGRARPARLARQAIADLPRRLTGDFLRFRVARAAGAVVRVLGRVRWRAAVVDLTDYTVEIVAVALIVAATALGLYLIQQARL